MGQVAALGAVTLLAASVAYGESIPGTAEPAPVPVPVEQFFQYPAVLEAKLSPSGRRLALTTSRGGKRVGLVVVELGDAPKATRAAAFSDADIVRFDWVGEDRLVFSVRDLETGSGEDRRYAPGLYSANVDGSDLRQLVRRRGLPFVVAADHRERSLEWNHSLLHVPLQQKGVAPDEVMIGKFAFGRDALESVTPLWLNVRSGRTRSAEMDGSPSHAVEWLFDSKGQARVATTMHAGRTAVHWRGPGETRWRMLVESDLLNMPFEPVAVDDAGTLYVRHSEGSAGYAVLSRFDFTKLAPHTPAQVSTPGFDFRGGLVMERASAPALGVRIETDAEQTVWFDEGMKRMQTLADERLPGRVNRLSCRRCGADDMVVLVRSFSDRDPGVLWLYEAAAKRWQPVSKVLDGIDPRRMATVDLKGSWWVDDDLSGDGRRHWLPSTVGDVEKDAEMLTAVSPVAQAKRIQAPLLLAFGEADRRVPIAHGERLRDALRNAGRPPEWISYPNEAHSWRQVSTNVDFARRVESFLARYLKADAP